MTQALLAEAARYNRWLSTQQPKERRIPCLKASIMATPMRSLTLEIGLQNSSLARRRALRPFPPTVSVIYS
jgi:hypothetical protein